MTFSTSDVAACCSSAPSRSRVSQAQTSVSWPAVDGLSSEYGFVWAHCGPFLSPALRGRGLPPAQLKALSPPPPLAGSGADRGWSPTGSCRELQSFGEGVQRCGVLRHYTSMMGSSRANG